MPRVRVVNHHIKKRGGVWWLYKRVPEAVLRRVGQKEWVGGQPPHFEPASEAAAGMGCPERTEPHRANR